MGLPVGVTNHFWVLVFGSGKLSVMRIRLSCQPTQSRRDVEIQLYPFCDPVHHFHSDCHLSLSLSLTHTPPVTPGLRLADNIVEFDPSGQSSIAHPGVHDDGHPGVGDGGHKPTFTGSFDGFASTSSSYAMVHGWVVDFTQPPSTPSNVSVLVDGKVVMTAVAKSLRPDLVPVVTSDPHHGFELQLPVSVARVLADGGNHSLNVLALLKNGSLTPLKGGPMCANRHRSWCTFPTDCHCGASASGMSFKVSNSNGCVVRNNTCFGKPCGASKQGCVPEVTTSTVDVVFE